MHQQQINTIIGLGLVGMWLLSIYYHSKNVLKNMESYKLYQIYSTQEARTILTQRGEWNNYSYLWLTLIMFKKL